jgi:hypothetical protein
MESRSDESMINEIFRLLNCAAIKLLHDGHTNRTMEHTIMSTTKQSNQSEIPYMVELSNLWNVTDIKDKLLLSLSLSITNGDSVQVIIVNNIGDTISTQIFDIDFKNSDYDQSICGLIKTLSFP